MADNNSTVTLEAKVRTGTGSADANRLRAAGRLPGIVYGKGVEPVAITVDHHEFRLAFTKPESRKGEFSLVIDGTPRTVRLQEIQRNPVRDVAQHVDYIAV